MRDFNERLKDTAVTPEGGAWRSHADYKIGPEDLVEISVFEVPELSRSVRVSAGGEISLPLIGVVKVTGLSGMETERLLTEILRKRYIKDPQVTVFVREFKSDPVAVLGAVKLAGLYQIQTPKTLMEVLAMAGGLTEMARPPGRTIVITRKRVGTASAARLVRQGAPGTSPSADDLEQGDVIEVPIKGLLQSDGSKWNVIVYPGDSIKVTFAGTVYVVGNVSRPGAFPLTDFDNISALQALALAGGTTKAASRKNAAVIHLDENGNRTEQKIDLSRILRGKDPDAKLASNDVLFVPGSMGKEAALRAVETSIQLGTGILIWRR